MNDDEPPAESAASNRKEWLVDLLVFGGLTLTALGVGWYSIPAATAVVGVVLMAIGFWAIR